MFFRQLLDDETACASYVFGCLTHPQLAVVEPHIDLVEEYLGLAEAQGAPIVAVLDTRLLTLPDHLVLYPSHYWGSVGGRGLSATPVSTVGFERRHNVALHYISEDEFVRALRREVPPVPAQQAAIVAANRSGRPFAGVS